MFDFRSKLLNIITSTLQGGYVSYASVGNTAKLFSEQLGLSEQFATQLIHEYFRGKYISAETAQTCADLIYQRIQQMNQDKLLAKDEKEAKEKRIKDLSRQIYEELCNSIRGGYVSYEKADSAAKSLSANLQIPYDFARELMLDYARGKYCSYDTASSYANMMAERILEKYENYPNIQEDEDEFEEESEAEYPQFCDVEVQTTVTGEQFDKLLKLLNSFYVQ